MSDEGKEPIIGGGKGFGNYRLIQKESCERDQDWKDRGRRGKLVGALM